MQITLLSRFPKEQQRTKTAESQTSETSVLLTQHPLSVRSGTKRLNLTHENSRCSFLATVVKNTTLSSRQMPAIVIRGCVGKGEPEPIIEATLRVAPSWRQLISSKPPNGADITKRSKCLEALPFTWYPSILLYSNTNDSFKLSYFLFSLHQLLKARCQGPTGWGSAKSTLSIRASHTLTALNPPSTYERPFCVMFCAIFTSVIVLFSCTPT